MNADNTHMSWMLHAQNKPKPKPNKPKPTGTEDTPTPNRDNTPTDDNTGLIQSAGTWLIDHPVAIPVILVAALVATIVGWAKFRNWRISKGIPTRGLGAILKDQIRFALKEDKRPVHPKLAILTGKRAYLLLIAATTAAIFIDIKIPAPIPLLVFLILFSSRYSKIAKARYTITRQMFDVANGEIKYPKGAELNPWRYVNISNWTNLVQPGQTVVNITAAYQSEDMKTRERFERNFNGTVSEENAWTYKWESAKNRIICQPAAFLPQLAPYPGPGPKWDEIPIGIMGDGTQATMPFQIAPHALICGPTGSGKSVLQRMILFHVLAHSDTWRIVAIDMKKVEMTWLRKYPSVLKVATDLEESVEVLRSLRAEMMRRYEEMEQQGVNHAKDLPDPPKAILCMIDETTVLLAAEGIKSDEGKERDELHAEAQMIIGELGRLSRASMIHVAMCFQRPDAKFLSGEIKANFDMRIAAGRMDTTPSLMVLDSEAANRLPKVKGRGMIRVGGELDTFQGYFAEQTWYDAWLAEQQGGPSGEPGTPAEVAAPVSSDPVEQSTNSEVSGAGAAGGKGRRGGGLKGLAAKAAAKAEARAARLDAEQGSEGAEADGGMPTVGAPEPADGSEDLGSIRRRRGGRGVVADPGPDEFDEAEPEGEGDLAVGLDDFLEPPSFDDDDFADDYEDGETGAEEDQAAPEPDEYVDPDRPVIPRPVVKPVPTYDPDAALPDWVGQSVAELEAAEAEPVPVQQPSPPAPVPVAAPVRPAPLPTQPPAGLPTRPPAGLPTRPPAGLPVRPPGAP